jgi:hypothetical protein
MARPAAKRFAKNELRPRATPEPGTLSETGPEETAEDKTTDREPTKDRTVTDRRTDLE